MGMQVGPSSGEDDVMVEMNTTPLIDVMLVLIIMLIVTIPVQTHAIKLDMPRPNNPPPPQLVEPEVINLEIDFDGTILWNGNTVASAGQLQHYLNQVARKDPQPEMHVRPHRLVKYDHVARVLGMAQRTGVKKMGFVGNEQYLQW